MYHKNIVSIITPNYNCVRFIAKTIDSVLAQTYKSWEMLIVDDCSTDGSYEIALAYAAKDSRIKVFRNEKNSGAAYSRNRAMAASCGEFVAFLDSDDLWLPDKLEKQVSFMHNNNYAFSYTQFSEIDSTNSSLNILVTGPAVVSRRMLYRSNYLGCLTVMYNQEKIGKICISPDIKKRNDHALWLKIIKQTNCYLLPECLAQYRKNNGLSKSSIIKMLKHHYYLYRKSEKFSVVVSFFYVFENLFFGFLRKKQYTKSISLQ